MKTTLDLPDDLVRQLASRAAEGGKTPEELAADLLSVGLSAGSEAAPGAVLVPKRLPRIKARPAVPANVKQMSGQESADWIKDLEQQHEIERYEKAFGHQHVDRADG